MGHTILSILNGPIMAISYKPLSVITWNCQNIAMLSIYQYQYQEKNHVTHGEMNMQFHFNNMDRPWTVHASGLINQYQTSDFWSPHYYSTLGNKL